MLNIPEHKIMDVIRGLIAQKVYDENTHHMFYGLVCPSSSDSFLFSFSPTHFHFILFIYSIQDADLVFLGLATTAKYFTVLRDSHVYTYCRGCGLPEHPTYECVKKLGIRSLLFCFSQCTDLSL